MTENMFPMRFTRAQLLECAEREISMRENVYPRWVEGQRMSQKKADAESRHDAEESAT